MGKSTNSMAIFNSFGSMFTRGYLGGTIDVTSPSVASEADTLKNFTHDIQLAAKADATSRSGVIQTMGNGHCCIKNPPE